MRWTLFYLLDGKSADEGCDRHDGPETRDHAREPVAEGESRFGGVSALQVSLIPIDEGPALPANASRTWQLPRAGRARHILG